MLSFDALESSLGLHALAARLLEGRFLRELTLDALSRQEGLTRERVRRLLHREVLRGKHILSRFPAWMDVVRRAKSLMRKVTSLEELAHLLGLPREELRRFKFLLRFFCEPGFAEPIAPTPPAASEIRAVILAAVPEIILGTTNLTAVLRGQRWRVLDRFWHHPCYGKLKLCSNDQVRAQIDLLVEERKLLRIPWKAYGKVGHVLALRGLPGGIPKPPSVDGEEAEPAPGG
jgi:hypothetical protein